ncbi:MAG: hypothetical protein ACTSX7_16375 [Alphaproteobacteria bacterium]
MSRTLTGDEVGAGTRHSRQNAIAAALMIAAAGLIFSWVAVYNGYPLVFHDSAEYIRLALEFSARWNGTPFYSVFMLPFHASITLWPVVLAQGIIVAHLIYLVIRSALGTVAPIHFAVTILALALFSSLPWFSGQLMPDLFTPVVVLGMALLGFAAHKLALWERIYLAVLTVGAISVHLTHVPLALGLAIVIPALHFIFARTRLPISGSWVLAVMPVMLAIAAILAFNTFAYGTTTLSPYGSVHPLARFIADGPARRYLQDACPQAGYALCQVVDELPDNADVFLWGGHDLAAVQANDGSVMDKVGGYLVLHEEAGTIIANTLREHFFWQLGSFIQNSWRQFGRFATGDGLRVYAAKHAALGGIGGGYADEVLQRHFPGEFNAYIGSRQMQQTLPIAAIRPIHLLAGAAAALAAIIVLAKALRRRQTMAIALFATILLALVGNAVISGGLSGVHDRYQSRVIWLVMLYALVFWPLLRRRPTVH